MKVSDTLLLLVLLRTYQPTLGFSSYLSSISGVAETAPAETAPSYSVTQSKYTQTEETGYLSKLSGPESVIKANPAPLGSQEQPRAQEQTPTLKLDYMSSLSGTQTGPKPSSYTGFSSKPSTPKPTGNDYLSTVSRNGSSAPASYSSTAAAASAKAPVKALGDYMSSLSGHDTARKPASYLSFNSKPKVVKPSGSGYLNNMSSSASAPDISYPSSTSASATAPIKASGDYVSFLSGPQTAPRTASYLSFNAKAKAPKSSGSDYLSHLSSDASLVAEDLSKAGKAENEWKDWVADDMTNVGKAGTDQHADWIAEDMNKMGETEITHMPHVKKQTESKKTKTELQAEDMKEAGKKTGYGWIALDMKEAGRAEDKASTKPSIDKVKDALISEREHAYDDVYEDMKKTGKEGSISSGWVAEDMKIPGRAESPSEKMSSALKDSSYKLGKWQKKALDVDEIRKDMEQVGHAASRDWVAHDMEATGHDGTLAGSRIAYPKKDLADWLNEDEKESIAKDLMKEGKAVGGTHSKQKVSRERLGDLVADDMKATGRTPGSWVEQDMEKAGHPEPHLNKEMFHISKEQREIEVMKTRETRAATPGDYLGSLSGPQSALVPSAYLVFNTLPKAPKPSGTDYLSSLSSSASDADTGLTVPVKDVDDSTGSLSESLSAPKPASDPDLKDVSTMAPRPSEGENLSNTLSDSSTSAKSISSTTSSASAVAAALARASSDTLGSRLVQQTALQRASYLGYPKPEKLMKVGKLLVSMLIMTLCLRQLMSWCVTGGVMG